MICSSLEPARYAEHAVMGSKPLLEFIGPGLEEISFKVKLDASCGVDPDSEFKTLQEIRDSGEVCVLVFGDTKIGKFILEGICDRRPARERRTGNVDRSGADH